MNTIISGPSLVAEVQKETIDRQKKIQSYLLLLHKNPNSRDLLYALSDLYRENGQSDLAHEYLLKAQSIDPTVR